MLTHYTLRPGATFKAGISDNGPWSICVDEEYMFKLEAPFIRAPTVEHDPTSLYVGGAILAALHHYMTETPERRVFAGYTSDALVVYREATGVLPPVWDIDPGVYLLPFRTKDEGDVILRFKRWDPTIAGPMPQYQLGLSLTAVVELAQVWVEPSVPIGWLGLESVVHVLEDPKGEFLEFSVRAESQDG